MSVPISDLLAWCGHRVRFFLMPTARSALRLSSYVPSNAVLINGAHNIGRAQVRTGGFECGCQSHHIPPDELKCGTEEDRRKLSANVVGTPSTKAELQGRMDARALKRWVRRCHSFFPVTVFILEYSGLSLEYEQSDGAYNIGTQYRRWNAFMSQIQ